MKIHCKNQSQIIATQFHEKNRAALAQNVFQRVYFRFRLFQFARARIKRFFSSNHNILLFVILGTYECQCNEGFKSTSKNQCEDIDECLFENGGCDHQCNNFIGSFQCSCHSGYHPSPDNLKMCVDIDECSSSNIDSQKSQNSPKCSDKVEMI